MPAQDTKAKDTPATAASAGAGSPPPASAPSPSFCPECGRSLEGKNPVNHAKLHYGKLVDRPDQIKNPEMLRRIMVLRGVRA